MDMHSIPIYQIIFPVVVSLKFLLILVNMPKYAGLQIISTELDSEAWLLRSTVGGTEAKSPQYDMMIPCGRFVVVVVWALIA